MADRKRVPLEYESQLTNEYETEVPPEDEAYSLEEILEEYGGGLERKLSEGAPPPEAAAPVEKKRRVRLGAPFASLAGRLKKDRASKGNPLNQAGAREEAPLEHSIPGSPSPDRTPLDSPSPGRPSMDGPSPDRPTPEPDRTAEASFSDMARETAERASHVLDGLRKLLGRCREPLSRAVGAVRRALAGVHLPALPAKARIPVLSAVGDRIEAARRKRRPKRTRGQPIPIPGRRRRAKAAEAVEAETVESGGPEPLEPVEAGTPEAVEPDRPEAAEPDAAPGGEPDTAFSEEPDMASSGEPENAEPDSPVEEVVGSTVDAVMEEAKKAAEEPPDQAEEDTSRTGKTAGTAEGPAKPGTAEGPAKPGMAEGPARAGRAEETGKGETAEKSEAAEKAGRADARRKRRFLLALFRRRKAGADDTPIGPEIPLHDAAARFREAYTRRQVPPLAVAVGGLPTLLLLLERVGFALPLWSGNIPLRCFLTLLCLGAAAYLCRQVFTGSVTAFACGVSAAAAACDCLVRMVSSTRSPGDGFGAVACLALIVAQWGVSLESRGRFETFRAASLDDDPPYLVTDMEQGACKQKGATPGFYSTAMRTDLSTTWQTVLLPLTLAVSVVLAGISSFGQDRGADFFLNWSAILAAGATFTLALCWGLPWARLSRRLQRSGGAVAGWVGAERISRQKNMIVTDADLFPAGAVQLNGIRLFGGDMDKAVSYAAAVTREASCGLEKPFDELLHTELGEGAEVPEAEEFNFYEEGGYGAVIDGQSVLMGTAAFLRRMGVLLPRDMSVPSGMFLAVDHRLLAVFAIRYNPSDNVDYALRLMRRSGVTPLLAVRDPNINPVMLQKKFRRRIPVKYPDLAGRIALSEVEFDRDAPRALLFREGLLPYAEAVVGCRRLCGGVRRATALSEFGSLAGMLLTFYLCYQGKFELLTPLSLTVFLLLWLIPVLLVMELF